MFRSRQRRKMRRNPIDEKNPKDRYASLYKRLIYVKKRCPIGEKPRPIKTHLRDSLIFPEMVQSIVNVHTGKGFSPVEIRPEMIGYYLGEFAMTYKRVQHGRPGVGATHSSKFVPIK